MQARLIHGALHRCFATLLGAMSCCCNSCALDEVGSVGMPAKYPAVVVHIRVFPVHGLTARPHPRTWRSAKPYNPGAWSYWATDTQAGCLSMSSTPRGILCAMSQHAWMSHRTPSMQSLFLMYSKGRG